MVGEAQRWTAEIMDGHSLVHGAVGIVKRAHHVRTTETHCSCVASMVDGEKKTNPYGSSDTDIAN